MASDLNLLPLVPLVDGLPPLPTKPGNFILRDGAWWPTDGLTARTFAHGLVLSPYGREHHAVGGALASVRLWSRSHLRLMP